MDAPPKVAPDVFAALPVEVIALIHWQAEQIRRLTARVAELEAKLGKNPGNSSKPPSSTHPHAKPPPVKPKSKRRRGAQPGHDKHERALIPVEECQYVVTCIPSECRKCGRELHGVDAEPLRHQVWELPEIKPLVTEYQQHRLVCSCGRSTCGELPAGVPSGQAGPRLIAFSGLLMACFRQSKRRAAQFLSMILNQPASAGWMVNLQNRAAEAVEPANNAAEQSLRHAVIWRKLSFGTQSDNGSRFVERMLTVIETCRRQKRDVYAWLTEAVAAHYRAHAAPSSLLAA